jgi:hypothetical protein
MHTDIVVEQGAKKFYREDRKGYAKRAKEEHKKKTLRPWRSSLRILCGYLFCFLLVPAGLCFTACPTEAENEGGDLIEVSLPIDGTGERHYYDLSSGTEVSNPGGDNWDLALDAYGGAFFVLTNSGVTAEETSSNGLGGVWFTDTTDFDAVTAAAQRTIPAEGSEYEPYTADVYRYTMVMAAEPVKQILNVITYAGYPSGDGLSAETRFGYHMPGDMAVYSPYNFNKKQAYRMTGMPPNYTPTKQVYIVRHGDGVKHSKVQLSEVYREAGSPSLFVMQVRYENFKE